MNGQPDSRMSITDVIGNRRTIHNFRKEPVPDYETISWAIEQARWAPNHHLTEPWHFYVPGKETVDRICCLVAEVTRAAKNERAAEMKKNRWQQIPGWLVLACAHSDDPVREREDYAACCCVAQNLMLLLWDKGIGTKWTTGEITRDDRFYALMHIDRQIETVVGLFWYGYAEEIPSTKRKPVMDIITRLD